MEGQGTERLRNGGSGDREAKEWRVRGLRG